MTDRFANCRDYESIFGIEPKDADSLSDEFWAKVLSKNAQHNAKCLKDSVRILSIGYGAGRLDLPLIASYARATAGNAKSIYVDALEPNWKDFRDRADQRLTTAGFQIANDAVVDDGTVRYVCKSDEEHFPADTTISIKASELDVNIHGANGVRYDVILCLFTIHLVDDWKITTQACIELLAENGVLVFAELDGTVSYLDGKVPAAKGKDHWSEFWRRIEVKRDTLFIPRTRIVSPRSLKVLYESLDMIGGVSAKAEIDIPDRSINGFDLERIVNEACNGIEAATFNSLRIPSNSLAKQFEKIWDSTTSSDEQLLYDIGIKLTAWSLPETVNVSRCGFLRKVAAVISQQAYQRTSDFSHIKYQIKALCVKNQYETDSKREALAAMLCNEREALGLSRNSMMHLNSRQGEDNYRTAITLLPKIVLGQYQMEKAGAFVDGFGVYVAANPQIHLSQLGGHSFGCFGQDLKYLIRFNVSTENEYLPAVKPVYAFDGTLVALIVDFPPQFLKYVSNHLSAEMCLIKQHRRDLYQGNLFGWVKASGMGEYCTYWGDFLKAVKQTREAIGNEDGLLLDLKVLPLASRAIDDIAAKLKEIYPDCVDDKRKQLAAVFVNACRSRLYFPSHVGYSEEVTAILAASVTSPFVHDKTPATSMLFLLSSSDCRAWAIEKGLDGADSNSEEILATLEQFQGVVRRAMEIEVGELLVDQAEKKGQEETAANFAHELKRVSANLANFAPDSRTLIDGIPLVQITNDKSSVNPEKAQYGTILLRSDLPSEVSDNIGLCFYPQGVRDIANLMTLWCQAESGADLRTLLGIRQRAGWGGNLEYMLCEVWKCSLRLLPLAGDRQFDYASEAPSESNCERLKSQLHRFSSAPALALKAGLNFIVNGSGKTLNPERYSPGDIGWLGRALLAILRDYARFTAPPADILATVECTQGVAIFLKITILSKTRNDNAVDVTQFKNMQGRARNADPDYGSAIHTLDVVNYCVGKLQGTAKRSEDKSEWILNVSLGVNSDE
jgi:hypothetical protein